MESYLTLPLKAGLNSGEREREGEEVLKSCCCSVNACNSFQRAGENSRSGRPAIGHSGCFVSSRKVSNTVSELQQLVHCSLVHWTLLKII